MEESRSSRWTLPRSAWVPAALVAITVVVASGFWLARGEVASEKRAEFATWVRAYGGEVVYAERGSDSGTAMDETQPAVFVKLPYGFPDSARREAEMLFPEAREIAVQSGDAAVSRLLGGEENVAMIRHSDSARATRLEWREPTANAPANIVDDFPEIGDAVPLSAETVGRLAGELLDPAAYQWYAVRGCIPIYGVRVRFSRGSDSLDVYFCMECDLLAFVRNGRMVGAAAVGSRAHNLFAASFKSAFPQDPVIQGISTNE